MEENAKLQLEFIVHKDGFFSHSSSQIPRCWGRRTGHSSINITTISYGVRSYTIRYKISNRRTGKKTTLTLLFGHSIMSDSSWPQELQHARLQILSKLRKAVKDREAWCAAAHGATKSRTQLSNRSIASVMPSHHLILSSPSPALSLSQHQGLFQWVSSSH